VFCDALRVKIRSDGEVKNQAVNLALGVTADGHLLDEAMADLSDRLGSSAVEPERVLVKATLKMGFVDAALRRRTAPAFVLP